MKEWNMSFRDNVENDTPYKSAASLGKVKQSQCALSYSLRKRKHILQSLGLEYGIEYGLSTLTSPINTALSHKQNYGTRHQLIPPRLYFSCSARQSWNNHHTISGLSKEEGDKTASDCHYFRGIWVVSKWPPRHRAWKIEVCRVETETHPPIFWHTK